MCLPAISSKSCDTHPPPSRCLAPFPSQLLHNSLEYLDENIDSPLKRKSPYILKRQATHTTKSRRPYILKRSTIYWQPSRRPRRCFRGPDHILSVKTWLCFFSLFLWLLCFYFPHRRFYPVRPFDCTSSIEACLCSAPQLKVLKIKSWASGKLCISKKLYLFTLFLHCTLSLFSFKLRLKDSWYKTSVMWPVIFSLIKLILYRLTDSCSNITFTPQLAFCNSRNQYKTADHFKTWNKSLNNKIMNLTHVFFLEMTTKVAKEWDIALTKAR